MHPAGALATCFCDALGTPVAPSEPERYTEVTETLQVYAVFAPVNRLATLIEVRRPTRRRVVAARRRSFDDKTIHFSGGTFGKSPRQRRRRDDG